MNLKQQKKLMLALGAIIIVGIAIGLILYALKQNINLFYTPSEALAAPSVMEQNIRLGGYVKKHSVHFNPDGSQVSFIITDRNKDIQVTFSGLLPNLFREGQTVVATGILSPKHTFTATQVLAKHDEKYMPKPLAEKLQQQKDRQAP